MNWPMVKLGDVCTINPRLPKNANPEQEVTFLAMAAVSEKGEISSQETRILHETKKGFTYFERGDVLLAKITPCFENGKATLTNNLNTQIGFGSTEFHVLRAIPALILPEFIFYLIWNKKFRIAAAKEMTGSAGQKRVSANYLKEYKFYLPSIFEQKKIVSALNKGYSIHRKRQQAIKLADYFLRATFLEMFGDPVMNPKGFEIKVLSDFFIDEKNGTKCGPFGSALKKDEYTREGVPVWNMDNITLKGGFIDLPSLWVSEYKYQELESYSVLDGDVIISRAGTVGKMGVVRSSTEKSIISTNLIRVRFGEKLYPEYFVSLMTYCKGRVGNLKTGPDGTFTHMNTGVLSNLEFPYPPLELQKKYIKIRQSVILLIDKYHHFGFGIDEAFCAINQKAFLCQP